jgi:hypothetical protein
MNSEPNDEVPIAIGSDATKAQSGFCSWHYKPEKLGFGFQPPMLTFVVPMSIG